MIIVTILFIEFIVFAPSLAKIFHKTINKFVGIFFFFQMNSSPKQTTDQNERKITLRRRDNIFDIDVYQCLKFEYFRVLRLRFATKTSTDNRVLLFLKLK